ncbi:MAG TPA: TIM barrel protein [Methanospirillum sp.]|nr:TIM barrel protein [Methanospirillum sp.]
MLWISTRCLKDSPLEIALESLGSLTRGVEIIDSGRHRIPSASLLDSFPYRYAIRIPQQEINLASIREPVRQASVAVVTERFTFAAEVQADVIISPGYLISPFDDALARRQLIRSVQNLIHSANEYGVTFLMRNSGRWEQNLLRTPEDLGLISQIPLALDIGHAHVNGCLPQFLHDGASRYLHLYDCRGISDEHLEVGRGMINFESIAASMYAQGARGVIDVPTYRGAYNSIRALRHHGIG